MTQNELAKAVTLLEGLKVSLSIGQVKEVLRCLKQVLKDLPEEERKALLKRMFG